MSNRRHRTQPIEHGVEAPTKLSFWARVRDRFAASPSLSPTCVAEVTSRVEADMMGGFLRSHGINAHVSADDAGGVDPILQLAFGVRVLVPPGHADEARRLLAEAETEG